MTEVSAIARLKVHEGKLEEYNRLDARAPREHRRRHHAGASQGLLDVGRHLATPTPELRKAIEGLDIRLYSPYQPM